MHVPKSMETISKIGHDALYWRKWAAKRLVGIPSGEAHAERQIASGIVVWKKRYLVLC